MPKIYLRKQNDFMGEASMEEAFPFLCEKKHIISLVGGGGKTTLMYALAEEYRKMGRKTLVTTTTHILRPESAVFAQNEPEIRRLWKSGQIAVAGCPAPEGKLAMLEENQLRRYCSLADAVLIEADGAKRMPCKVPGEQEPVILAECDIVIGVLGLDSVGQTLEEACFRTKEAVKLLGVSPQHVLSETDLAAVLSSTRGTRKGAGDRDYYVVLNKCDNDLRKESGQKILQSLLQNGIENVAVTSFYSEV